MNEFNLCSHNSMSYLRPKKWYLYPFRFIAKCQSKSIKEQIENYGIRIFDLRIGFGKDCCLEFRHGYMSFKGDVYDVLNYLNKYKVWVRLIYEDTQERGFNKEVKSQLFSSYCGLLERKYSNIKFFEGRRKSDWMLLYEFKNKIELNQKVGSMTSKIWAIWPWLYAITHNKSNRKKHENSEKCLVLDFINHD